jgi:hypothetical protein
VEDQDKVVEPAPGREAGASDLAADPGRTAGQAEGSETGTAGKAPEEPGKTPGQAEGDPETVEDDLRQKGRQ